jgi:ABC-type uncharacterized transport system YnjBCD ATPase subunit
MSCKASSCAYPPPLPTLHERKNVRAFLDSALVVLVDEDPGALSFGDSSRVDALRLLI